MVPLSEYAVISDNATLFEAVQALENIQKTFRQNNYPSRAILVQDNDGNIVGKISQLDVLRALEPKYAQIKSDMHGMARYGFSKDFLLSILEKYEMFDGPMDGLCKKAGMEKASQFMHKPAEGECIDADASFDQALHMLIIGSHQSLLVTEKDRIVGILRLTDAFENVYQHMKECKI